MQYNATKKLSVGIDPYNLLSFEVTLKNVENIASICWEACKGHLIDLGKSQMEWLIWKKKF